MALGSTWFPGCQPKSKASRMSNWRGCGFKTLKLIDDILRSKNQSFSSIKHFLWLTVAFVHVSIHWPKSILPWSAMVLCCLLCVAAYPETSRKEVPQKKNEQETKEVAQERVGLACLWRNYCWCHVQRMQCLNIGWWLCQARVLLNTESNILRKSGVFNAQFFQDFEHGDW